MEIKLISKVSDTIKIFMTPMGVQVWVKNLPTRKPHKDYGVRAKDRRRAVLRPGSR